MGSRGHRNRGRSSFREGIKSVNVSEIRCREVTTSKIRICQNLVTETLKNKNYLVASSKWGLAIDTHDSKRKRKEKQLLCRFKWQDRIMENEKTPGLWKKRQKQTTSLYIQAEGIHGGWTTWERAAESVGERHVMARALGGGSTWIFPHLLATLNLISSFSPETQIAFFPLCRFFKQWQL